MLCQACGKDYKSLGNHWQWNESHVPELSDYQVDIITGLLMGDANIQTDKNSSLVVRMTNEEFLEDTRNKLSEVAYNVRLYRDSDEQYELTKELPGTRTRDGTSDLYGFRTAPHPVFNKLSNWYMEDGKRFPNTLELNLTIFKYWYVCDGWMNGSNLQISCSQRYRNDMKQMFNNFGYDPTIGEQKITFSVSSSKEIIGSIDEPVTGFERKFKL